MTTRDRVLDNDAATARAGVVGCGMVSEVYLRTLAADPSVDVVGCADLDAVRASRAAAAHGTVPMAVDDLLADPSIDLVVNVTPPAVHADVTLAALAAGKSVWSEKPLATNRADGRRILDDAAAAGLTIGCAPDTFLGAGLQTSRRLIDAGAIGEPLAATAFCCSRGPEAFHPEPGYLYQPGAGPLHDMAPYYLTAIAALLGPIRSVTAMARAPLDTRTVQVGPRRGESFPVDVPTHVSAVLELRSGALVTLVASFDVQAHELPRIEVYGSEATLSMADPNTFDGPVRLRRARADAAEVVPLDPLPVHDARGLGVADLVAARAASREPRASAALAFHVLDAMEAILDSARRGRSVRVMSTCTRPDPLLATGAADA